MMLFLKILLVLFGIGTLGFILFFLVATSLGTKSGEAGIAWIRTGLGDVAVSVENSIGASMLLHRVRGLDLDASYPMRHQQTIRTKDRATIQVDLAWVWALPPSEVDILMMMKTIGYKKGTDAQRLEVFLRPRLTRILTTIGPHFSTEDWRHQEPAIYQALLRYLAPQQYGYQVHKQHLTIQTTTDNNTGQ